MGMTADDLRQLCANLAGAKQRGPTPVQVDPRLIDTTPALSLLAGVVGMSGVSDVVSFVHSNEPIAKGRARWSHATRSFYTPDRTLDAEDALVADYLDHTRGRTQTECVAMAAVFFRPNYQRIDGDNMMKLVMDAGTKARLWIDDCYVVVHAARIELDAELPRTVIAFGSTRTTFDRAHGPKRRKKRGVAPG